MDEELEKFKRDIDLRVFAASVGFQQDEKESSANCCMMRNASGDKIAISYISPPNNAGRSPAWYYVNNHDDKDNGSIIDFLQNRGGGSLGNIRKKLREWMGEAPKNTKLPRFEKLETIEKDLSQVTIEYERAAWVASVPYLIGRGLDVSITNSHRFRQTFKLDGMGNVLFPHRNKEGLCGFEKKNLKFTGFAKGALKGLWASRCFKTDKALVLVEAAIDAFSYEILKRPKDARYLSTGGNMHKEQLELIKAAIDKAPEAEIILAFDNDKDGEKMAAQVRGIAPPGARISRPLPRSNDWNQDLKDKLGLK